MAIKNLEPYIERLGLDETIDPDTGKRIYRRPGFSGVVSLEAIEEACSRFLRKKRDARNLNRKQVGMMVGIHAEVYARHERAGARLTVARLRTWQNCSTSHLSKPFMPLRRNSSARIRKRLTCGWSLACGF